MGDPGSIRELLHALADARIGVDNGGDRRGRPGEVLTAFARLSHATGGSYYLCENSALKLAASLDPGHAATDLALPLPKGSFLWKVHETKSPLLVRGAGDERLLRRSGGPHYRDDSSLLIPILGRGNVVVGVVCLHNKSTPPFDAGDRDLCLLFGLLSGLSSGADSLQEDLGASEGRYREIFENTSDGLVVAEVTPSMRYRIVSMNPAQERMLGLSGEGVVGRYFDEVVPAAISEAVARHSRRCVESGELVSFEEEAELDSGRYFFETTLIPIKDDAGRVARLIGVTRDVTAQKAAKQREREREHRLFQAAKHASLGTLVSGFAHEINNPNNFIRLNAQNLGELWSDIAPILDQAAIERGELNLHGIPYESARSMINGMIAGIEEGSKRIEKLLGSLREYAGGEDRSLTEEVDVNQAIRSGITIVRNLVRTSTDNFSIELTDPLPSILGSYHQIEQVVINLITNACQSLNARADGIDVRTFLNEDGRSILLEVADEGSGIPKGVIPRIFDPFFTTKKAEGGSGLGLAVCSRIVANHGGEMSFHSVPGQGTRVTVRFPIAGGVK